ncbi:MAG: hypothetical protein JWQ04_3414 [Pedosphaera sp.]|nr:hypothetical protein [Pedosphaera sp.]
MNWFYASNDQQCGPVSDSQLDALLSSGTISRDTLVWREGMTEWKPLHAVRAAGPPPVPNVPSMVCAECGGTFPAGELIQLNRAWVCAKCKPVFLQKMSEGVASTNAAGRMWRMNKQLVTISETPFPDRCVKCNAPANGFRLKRVLYWQHPAYYLLLLCNLLVLLVVVLIVRKKAVLHVGLCGLHRAQRKQTILIGWLGALGGLTVGLGAFAFSSTWAAVFGVTGFLVFIASAIYGALKGPMVSAAKVTKENVWLKGVHRDFMANLPEWPGQ